MPRPRARDVPVTTSARSRRGRAPARAGRPELPYSTRVDLVLAHARDRADRRRSAPPGRGEPVAAVRCPGEASGNAHFTRVGIGSLEGAASGAARAPRIASGAPRRRPPGAQALGSCGPRCYIPRLYDRTSRLPRRGLSEIRRMVTLSNKDSQAFGRARDELFSHINRCGVLKATAGAAGGLDGRYDGLHGRALPRPLRGGAGRAR